MRMSTCTIIFPKMEKFHGENTQGTYHTPPLPASDWMPSPPKEDLPKSLPTIISCPLSKFWCNLTIWTVFLNKWSYTRQDSQTADSSYLSINHPSHISQQLLYQGRWYPMKLRAAECMAWGDEAILRGIPLAHSFTAQLQSNQKWSLPLLLGMKKYIRFQPDFHSFYREYFLLYRFHIHNNYLGNIYRQGVQFQTPFSPTRAVPRSVPPSGGQPNRNKTKLLLCGQTASIK